MKVAHAVLAFWLILIAAAVLLSGCSLVSSPNLSQQMQQATVDTAVGNIVFSDTNVWQVIGYNVAIWNNNKAVSELFLYGSEVSLAALTGAIVAVPQASTGLAIGQGIWMALLKIFRPAEYSLAYTQGMILTNNATAEYTMCLSNSGRVVVPRNVFTPCGAILYTRTVSAINIVMALKGQLLQQAQDVLNVQPVKIELPKEMTLPKRELTAPQATIP